MQTRLSANQSARTILDLFEKENIIKKAQKCRYGIEVFSN